MEFEKALRMAEEYLTFTPEFIGPKAPQGIWFCDNTLEVSAVKLNAVCLGAGWEMWTLTP